MKSKISSVVVPLLLLLTGLFSYFTLKYNWNFEIASYSIFLFTLFYILAAEQIVPLKQDWKLQKSTLWVDLKHFVFSTALFDALGKMLSLSLILYFQERFFLTIEFWDSFPFFITYIMANLIGEFLPYLYHWYSHKGNVNSYLSLLFWKIHSIHHLPTNLNWFKTNWNHPINIFINALLKMIPILLLGFNKEIVFLVTVTHVVIAYSSHANIRTEKSVWDYLIVTPHIHHFHHSNKLKEAKNYGNIIPFWDLIFGTYYNRKGKVDEVGIVETDNTKYPHKTAYFKQLSFPISALKGCCKSKISF